MHFGSGGLGGAQARHRLRGIQKASARYCAERWAYYNPVSGKYMGDDGEWHACR
ncbi:BA14K family protein [Bradyrhizobium erythrophlei]